MAVTTIADLQIVPSKFTEYTLEKTTEKSMLVKSGIVTSDPTVSQIIDGTPKGGNLITMPYYNPLTGEDEVFGEEEIGVDKITTDNEVATLLVRQKAWGDTDLSKVFGGTDPISAIGNLIADWWNEREQAVMLSVLKGILNPTNGALKAHVLDVSAASGTDAIIGVDNTLDAKQLMGDAYDKLGMVFMHSATYTQLQKQQNIETEYDATLKIKIDYYLGYQVIVDDGMPYDSTAKTYMTYFLGKGVFARDDGMPRGLIGTEVDRNKLKAQNILINRRALVMHPLGLSWKADATLTGGKKYAANADLEKAANWTRKKDLKNIAIVALKHKIEANPSPTV
nr:MAG TPA: major capsid protein [Caudoviricetes sp.]